VVGCFPGTFWSYGRDDRREHFSRGIHSEPYNWFFIANGMEETSLFAVRLAWGQGKSISTFENRPNSALLVVDMQNGVIEGAYKRDVVVANEKARRERVPIIWVQHSDGQLARGSDRLSRRTTETPSRPPPLRWCYRAWALDDSSSSAHRAMPASAQRSTARSSGLPTEVPDGAGSDG
jgi:hypothetical protein